MVHNIRWQQRLTEHKILLTVAFGLVVTYTAWKYLKSKMSNGEEKRELESSEDTAEKNTSSELESEITDKSESTTEKNKSSKQPVSDSDITHEIKSSEEENTSSEQHKTESDSDIAVSNPPDNTEISAEKDPDSDSDITDQIESSKTSESNQTSSDDQSGADPAIMMKRGIKVIIKCGNITHEQVDVIVNAANGRLAHGGGVARAIAVKAGRGIDEEGQRKLRERGSPLKVSEVLHTRGYNLNAEFVVHAVGPIRGRDDRFHTQLRKTFFNCLDYADQKLEAKSIAIPLISSGIFGGQKMECAKELIDAVNSFTDDDKFSNLKDIRLVNIDDEATNAIKKLASDLKTVPEKES